MTWFALRRDPTTQLVLGSWSGPDGAVPPSTPQKECVRVTQEQWGQSKTKFLGSRQPRWKLTGDYPNQVLTEETDSRPMTRWIADPNGAALSTSDGVVEYELDVGDPAGEVRVELIDDQGNVRTNVNATRRIPVGQYRLKVQAVNGVATIVVPTARAREVVVAPNDLFNMENILVVNVVETEL